METLTIFTPTYNRAYCLHLGYEALCRQTCKDFVWLIVDDGSTDNTAELVHSIDTYYNDVDINGHINSVKYIEHVLDLWDINWYKEHQIRRFEIAYVAEAHAGDKLSFYMQQAGEREYDVRICKTDPENGALIETCRSKVTFG